MKPLPQKEGASSVPDHQNPELITTDLQKTPEGRKLLKYLISCALPAERKAYIQVDNERHVFSGSMGLAPNWLEHGMSLSERRWVSACILARTNYFGKTIKISLRSSTSTHSSLKALPDEQRDFPIHEGGFFGDLFQEKPEAYVCSGKKSEAELKDPIFNWRICAKPIGNKEFTQCRFKYVGTCSAKPQNKIGTPPYKEIIHVYVKPGEPEKF